MTVSKFLATMGIEYLGPTKESVTIEHDLVVNWQFLKRKSCHVPEISHFVWLAQIDKDVIGELTNWIRVCDDEYLATVENVQTALRFAFFMVGNILKIFGKRLLEHFAGRMRLFQDFILGVNCVQFSLRKGVLYV